MNRSPTLHELHTHIDGIAPAIELPNLHYESPSQLSMVDLVATNVAAAAYIVGDFASPAARDPNEAATAAGLQREGSQQRQGATMPWETSGKRRCGS